MIDFTAYNPLDSGIMVGIIGPPGFGKSTFIRRAIELLAPGRGWVALSPAREAVSYTGLANAEGEIFEDTGWVPTERQFSATAYVALMKALRKLKDRPEIKVVALDTMTRQLGFAYNSAIAPYQTDDFATLGQNKFNLWAALKSKSIELCDTLEMLRSSGKHIICAFHQDVREIEGAGVPKKVTDAGGRSRLEWDMGKAPEVQGSFRDSVGGRFDIFGFLERDIVNDKATHWLRVHPSERAWAKTAITGFDKPRIPADFREIMATVERSRKETR